MGLLLVKKAVAAAAPTSSAVSCVFQEHKRPINGRFPCTLSLLRSCTTIMYNQTLGTMEEALVDYNMHF